MDGRFKKIDFMQAGAKYNDVRFFLVAIAFISAFDYYLTYSNIHFNWLLIMTYTIDTAEGWLAWWAVRSIIIYLDIKMPYNRNVVNRIVIQTLLTTFAGMLVIISLTELVSWIVKGRPAVLNFYTFDIFIIAVWFFVINGIYVGMHYYYEWKQSELKREEEKKLRAGGFTVKQGNFNLLITFNDIMGFYSEDGYTYLQTWQKKKYCADRSLDKTEELLPEEIFFRLNRRYILNRTAMSGYKKTGQGKLDVMVKAAGTIPPFISVSRERAVQFKKWFVPDDN